MYLCGLIPTRNWSTPLWNPSMFQTTLGFINQVLDPNKRVSFNKGLKEDLEVHALDPRSCFKAVVKDTLFFLSKTWLMNPRV